MNARVITALIVTGVLGWTMPTVAQADSIEIGFSDSAVTTPLTTNGADIEIEQDEIDFSASAASAATEIDFLSNTFTTRPATALKKFLWSGVLFFHPNDSYTPIPLYGYAQASRWDDIYMQALREVARGKVHVAVAEWTAEDVYRLHGIFVDESTIESVADYFKELKGNDLITFTRPLQLKVDTPEVAAEFITLPGLWARPAVQ